jgi:hypothetical protein
MATNTFIKDPDAELNYVFDWSSWLPSGVTISSQTTTVQTGLTLESESITDSSTSVTVKISGGTNGSDYTVANKVTLSDGQIDERTIYIRVRQR